MIGSILIFLIVLSVLILVHEVGHFFAARKAGVKVEEFGLGYPPRIFGKKIRGTIYSINLLPFGGFVRLHGEMGDEGVTSPRRAFINKSKKTRAGILLAGVTMNFLLAILAFAVVYSFSGIPRKTNDVTVVEVVAGSPAQVAKILVGDIVRKVDGEEITAVDEFVGAVEEKKGERIVLEVERIRGEERSLKEIRIIPREEPPEDEGHLGVIITSTEIYYPPVWQRPFVGAYHGFKEAVFWGTTIVSSLAKVLIGLFKGEVPKDIAGPVGIFAITSEAAKFGVLALINFVGILSVNLAILNIVPFPALDGGRLLFIAIETVLGKKVLPKIETIIHTVGMAILILLLLAITVQDIRRLISAGGISGLIDSVLR